MVTIAPDFAYNQKVENPLSGVHLPDEGDEAVADFLGVGGVAREFLAQEFFFDDDAQGEEARRDEGQEGGGVRFQPEGHADQQRGAAGVHRMADHGVDAGIDHGVLSIFLKFDHGCGEGVFPEGEGDEDPAGDDENQSDRRNERAGFGHQMKFEHVAGDEEDHRAIRDDKEDDEDFVRERLTFLEERFEAFAEQVLVTRAEAGQRGGGADEDRADEHPGPPPITGVGGHEQQDRKQGGVVYDAGDQFEDEDGGLHGAIKFHRRAYCALENWWTSNVFCWVG